PALIGVVGAHVEVTRWRGVIAAGLVSITLLGVAFSIPLLQWAWVLAVMVLLVGLAFAPLKKPVPHRRQPPVERTLPYRWSRLIQRRPWPAAIAGVVVLGVLALPVLGLRL